MIVPHIPANLGDAAAPLAPAMSWCDGALDAHVILAAFRAVDLLPAAGITLILMALLMGYRKRRARSAGPRRTPAEELERARQMRGMRGDLEQLMVEIEQLAKRFATQLDAKTMELEDVCRDADRKIAELKKLMDRAESTGVAPHGHGEGRGQGAKESTGRRAKPQAAGAASDMTTAPAPHAERFSAAACPETAAGAQQAPDSRSVNEHASGSSSSSSGADTEDGADAPDPLARSVYRLADQGLDPPAIAGKLNEHVGKIELILALRTT